MDAEFLQQVLQELVADQTGAAVAGPQVMYIVVSAHAAGELPSCCSPSGHELTYKLSVREAVDNVCYLRLGGHMHVAAASCGPCASALSTFTMQACTAITRIREGCPAFTQAEALGAIVCVLCTVRSRGQRCPLAGIH